MLGVQPTDLVFLDTETTGLWGGGTVPFLVGLGFIEHGRLKTEQLMLGQLGRERPLLERLLQRLVKAKALVTYNGKSFDWPLIKARFLMNRLRLPPTIEHLPHLDLLFVARRLLVGLPDHRLSSVEQYTLGFARKGDIPGHAIPDAYFAFLKHRDVSRMAQVVEHNRLDILAMFALVAELAQRLCPLPPGRLAAGELLAVARLMYFAERAEEALEYAFRALCSGEGQQALAAAVWAAKLHGRQGAWRKAAQWLERALLANKNHGASQAHFALAKIFEHRLVDLPRALRHAERCGSAEEYSRHQKRLNRLKKKLAASQSRRRLGPISAVVSSPVSRDNRLL